MDELRNRTRKFRRKLLLARSLLESLGTAGFPRLEMQGDADGLKATCSTSDEEGATRFVVAIRPLVNPTSDIEIRKLWEDAKAAEPELFAQIDCLKLEEALRQMRNGNPELCVDGKEVDLQKQYKLIADAGYFIDDPEALTRSGTRCENVIGTSLCCRNSLFLMLVKAKRNRHSILFVQGKDSRTLRMQNACLYQLFYGVAGFELGIELDQRVRPERPFVYTLVDFAGNSGVVDSDEGTYIEAILSDYFFA